MAQMFENLLREHVKRLIFRPDQPFESAVKRDGSILLNANENPFGSPAGLDYHRYSESDMVSFLTQVAQVKRVHAQQICLANGTEMLLSRIISAFCEPAEDNILVCTPTSSIYERVAMLQNVQVKKVPLDSAFQPDIEAIAQQVDYFTKAIILCSPNNPTGNAAHFHNIEVLLNNFDGLLVVDEAYINFSRQRSLVGSLEEYPNLIVLQTLSIAWGLAGLRIAMAIAQRDLAAILNQLGTVHTSISQPAIAIASQAIEQLELINSRIKDIVALRNYFAKRLADLPLIECVYPSDANFLLVKCRVQAATVIGFLKAAGILVGIVPDLPYCIRITVGTLQENELLLEQLQRFKVH